MINILFFLVLVYVIDKFIVILEVFEVKLNICLESLLYKYGFSNLESCLF